MEKLAQDVQKMGQAQNVVVIPEKAGFQEFKLDAGSSPVRYSDTSLLAVG